MATKKNEKPQWLIDLESKDTPAVNKSSVYSDNGSNNIASTYQAPAGLGVNVKNNQSASVFNAEPTKVSSNTYSPTYSNTTIDQNVAQAALNAANKYLGGTQQGNNSVQSNPNYTIGSQLGQNIANNMPVGGTYTASDGSNWYKNPDGTMKVTHNGITTENAYQANVYNPTRGQYNIASEDGVGKAHEMPIGSSWVATDGSYWVKENDGSITVYDNGTVTRNAYKPGVGNYQITSDYGMRMAEQLGIGEEWQASDGSKWRKNPDGTVSVKYNGITTDVAYRANDLGNLGRQQMEAGLPAQDVLATYMAMEDKTSPEAQSLWGYYIDALKSENAPEYTSEQVYDYFKNNQPTYDDQYDEQMQELLNQILNREDFSYNAEDDPLYQQYAKMFNREGDRAMRDTMAEAAASAGGMNSYAVTAAQQAANYYSSQLGDKIPELYQLAYQMYLDDKQADVQNLNLLGQMSDRDYERYRGTMQDYYADQDFAYNLYRDDVLNGQWNQQFDWNNANADRNFMASEKEFDYNKSVDDREWNQYLDEVAYGRQWDTTKWNHEMELYADSKAATEYERGMYEKEFAQNTVKDLINLGATSASIPDEVIEKAGYTRSQVDAMAAEHTKLLNFQ